MAGWSPISPNRTLGRRCRLGAKAGAGFSDEGGAVDTVIAAVAVVIAVAVAVVVVAVGPPGIGASGGCSSVAIIVAEQNIAHRV